MNFSQVVEQDDCVCKSLNDSCCFGNWSQEECGLSSTWRELEAIHRFILNSVDCLQGKNVLLHTDSKNATRILQVGSKKQVLHDIALSVHQVCNKHNIDMSAAWIPREMNVAADKLSRLHDCDDWGIQYWLFQKLDRKWGPHEIDRFAFYYNTKCQRFNSRFWCAGTEAVDAFKQVWLNELNWLVPPPSLICKTIRKLRSDRASGTLVVPNWKSAPFWTLLRKDLNLHGHIETALGEAGTEINDYVNKVAQNMATYLIGSKSDSTVRSYFQAFKRWDYYAKVHGFVSLPAQPIHVALFITSLLDSKSSIHVINSVIYGIKWAHDLNCFSDPTKNSYILNLQQSAKRSTQRPVSRKEPVTPAILIALCEHYRQSTDLLIIGDLTIILFSFSGFLRFDEIVSLKCKDVKIHGNFLALCIERSKTDQFRQGNEVLIAKGDTIACPLSMFTIYLQLSDINLESSNFLFRPLFRSHGIAHLIHRNRKLSYTTVRERFLNMLASIGCEGDFGLHSLRSGGATAAANANVNDRCWKRHGRWSSDSSKDRYVVDSIENRLSVSSQLGL